jgi:hypothetical protein
MKFDDEVIEKAVEKLCLELNKHISRDFLTLSYESGLDENVLFKDRIRMAVYLEFIKAGIVK